ncbi:MAG: thiopeptide-type bacteriocin biosynthesis protein [Pseudonocardia sp.]
MSADHLNTTSPYELAADVLTVLAGADLEATAANSALNPADLDEALQIYQTAGLAALERRAEHEWYQVRVEFPDWSTAEAVGAAQLGPRLDRLQADGVSAGWWFLRKHPCWRLRLHGVPAADAATAQIGQLTENVRVLLSISDLAASELFTSSGPVAHAAPWLAAFQAAGRRLGVAATRGHLDRGVRAILTHVLIFHWNRFGLSAASQGILARAATTALLPRS